MKLRYRFYDFVYKNIVSFLQLAQAFFAFWLDPRARQPELHQQLLGTAP
jgi:hypothetical protein